MTYYSSFVSDPKKEVCKARCVVNKADHDTFCSSTYPVKNISCINNSFTPAFKNITSNIELGTYDNTVDAEFEPTKRKDFIKKIKDNNTYTC